MGNMGISTNLRITGIGEDSACPAEPTLRFALVLTTSGIIAPEGI
jgi:hypothetical protein